MAFDGHKNNANGTSLSPPSPALSGASMSLQTGQGTLMPATPFNATVWPAGVLPLATTAEIVRVTTVVGDVLTIARAQEGSSPIAIAAGYQLAVTITAKNLTDIETAVATNFHRGTLAARPSSLTLFDAGYWYLAEDEDGGTPYLWTGVAWEKAGQPVGGDTLRVTQSPYNCKADGVKLSDGAVTLAQPNVLTSAAAQFTAADVGKIIAIESIGAGGGSQVAKVTSGANTLTQSWYQVQIKNATGGTWAVTHTGLGTVSGVAYNVTAGALQTALEALYGAGKVSVALSGTTYTIALLSGAADQDTTKVSTTSSLTGAQNGATPAAPVFNQTWTYGDVGKRIHITGAGAGGTTLAAWVGSIDASNSNIAYLVDVNGANLNASVSGTFTYHTLNWLRTTIASYTDAHTLNLTASIDAGVQVDMTGLEVWYGTDNYTGLQQAVTDAGTQGVPLDMGTGTFLTTRGITSTIAGGDFRLFGQDAQWRCLAVDSEAESGRFAIGGNADTTAGKAKRLHLTGWSWGVPAAHHRGVGSSILTIPLGTTTKTNSAGFFITRANKVSVHRMIMDTCYGIGFTFQSCRYGLVSHCESWSSWADSFNINNNNGQYNSPLYGDFTFFGCSAFNSGDDNFAINHRNGNAPRGKNINFIGCRASSMRNCALGRGFAMAGGSNVNIAGCSAYGMNGCSLDILASLPDNCSKGATVTTPGTGAQLVYASPPANITAGTTEMMVFDGAGNNWVGSVTAVSGDGLTITLTARADMPTTCPFTGSNLYAQWGASNSGARYGTGGCDKVNVTGFIGDVSNLNTAGDSTASAAIRIAGGNATTTAVTDVTITGVQLYDTGQSGILVTSIVGATPNGTVSDVTAFGSLVRDVSVENFSIARVGYSSLAASKPWAGLYVNYGQDVAFRNGKIRDTDNAAFTVSTISTHVSGRITATNITGSDIGRSFSTGTPLHAAFDPGVTSNYTGQYERLYLTNPSGTSGGTKYVSTYVLGQAPTGSTVFGINSDIANQTLIDESGSGYTVVISPIFYRGKGSPEGVVTAGMSALYQQTDNAGVWEKTTTTGNTGWTLMASGSVVPAPEWDGIYTLDPTTATSSGNLVQANRIFLCRVRGSGTITKVGVIPVTVTSGNVMVAVYANNGSTGYAAKPTGAPLATSSSTAVNGLTTSVWGDLTLSQSVAVTHLNHWFAIMADSTVPTFVRTTTVQAAPFTNGTGWLFDTGAFSFPTLGAVSASSQSIAMRGQ